MHTRQLLILFLLVILLVGLLPAAVWAMLAEPGATPLPATPPEPAPGGSLPPDAAPAPDQGGIESLSGSNVTFNPSAGGHP